MTDPKTILPLLSPGQRAVIRMLGAEPIPIRHHTNRATAKGLAAEGKLDGREQPRPALVIRYRDNLGAFALNADGLAVKAHLEGTA